MDEMTAFERQLAAEMRSMVGPMPRFDVAAIAGSSATTPHKWRFQSMFSATKFAVAGAIVALFGGFLLTGVLTQQPSDEPLPPAAGSASAAPEAEATASPERSIRSDLLPGVDLEVEDIAPGVFRVVGDGYRTGQGLRVVVSATGDVWLLRGRSGDWNIVRLGEPGVSLHRTDGENRRLELRLDRGGRPIIDSIDPITGTSHVRVFDGTAWVRTDPEPGCGDSAGTLLADGTCWQSGPSRRVDQWHWRPVPKTETGLAADQGADRLGRGPDGSGWFTIRTADPESGVPIRFDGLLHYDGRTWTRIPYPSSAERAEGRAITREIAVAPDETVWMVESTLDGRDVRVRRWGGTTWSSYELAALAKPLLGDSVAGEGAHFNDDGTIWFMYTRLFFDGESLQPFDLERLMSRRVVAMPANFAPDGTIWLLDDRRLYVVTPEAVVAGG